MSASIQELFNISDQLAKNLEIPHKLAVPKMTKIVVNAGIGSIKEDNKAIEKMKKGLASVGKVKYALKKAAESFETWQGLSISEVNDVLVDMVSSAQDYIKLVEDGDLKSVDEPEVEIAKGMPLSFKQFQSKIGD